MLLTSRQAKKEAQRQTTGAWLFYSSLLCRKTQAYQDSENHSSSWAWWKDRFSSHTQRDSDSWRMMGQNKMHLGQMPAIQSLTQSSNLCGTSFGVLTSMWLTHLFWKPESIHLWVPACMPFIFQNMVPIPFSAKPGDWEQEEQWITSKAALCGFSE